MAADGQSFQRMLLRPPRGIGEGLLAQIMAAENAGLRVVDMVSPSVHKYGDPFGQLLQDYKNGSVTVFDTETTGINPGEDEVVEIAAVRLERGRIADRFQRRSGISQTGCRLVTRAASRRPAMGAFPGSAGSFFTRGGTGSTALADNLATVDDEAGRVVLLVAPGAEVWLPLGERGWRLQGALPELAYLAHQAALGALPAG